MFQYLPYLNEHNIEAVVCPLFDDEYLKALYNNRGRDKLSVIKSYFRRFFELTKVKKIDLIWLQGELFPWIPALIEQLSGLARIPYIVDYDDAIFHNYDLHNHRIVRLLLRNKINKVMRNSVLVVAGNEYLAERAQMSGAARVEILPTVVDTVRYTPGFQSPKNHIKIGWIGSPTTAKYLSGIVEALQEICMTHKNVCVDLVGAGNVNLKGVVFKSTEWSEETEVSQIQTFDLGIMPLPDTPWNRGKCGYKIIQYMACGIPAVGSPVGINSKIISNGRNGYLATTTEEWLHALETLIEDSKLRKVMGNNGRQLVEEKYSLESNKIKLIRLLESGLMR
jgi:glycosyltransferase involved in cell wall biosynthesis